LSFGVPLTSNPHHFMVEIPRNNTGAVRIVENLGLQSDEAHIPIAVGNWLALRHALGDVAQNEYFKPRITQAGPQNTPSDDENGTLSLFDFEP
jgi:hypothetical protein